MERKEWSDESTTLAELRAAVQEFVEQRDWGRYHTPKNLSMSIAIEAAELMEIFQWRTAEGSAARVADPQGQAELAGELADVLIYCLSLANGCKIDISRAVQDKLARNQGRFPVGFMPES